MYYLRVRLDSHGIVVAEPGAAAHEAHAHVVLLSGRRRLISRRTRRRRLRRQRALYVRLGLLHAQVAGACKTKGNQDYRNRLKTCLDFFWQPKDTIENWNHMTMKSMVKNLYELFL